VTPKKPSNKIKSISALTKRPRTNLSESSQFPIVGVGASAGGLEAFTQLFKYLPADPGMAFVLIQHLAPAHESMLTGLLSKAISMPVKEVKDGMTVEPNNVYVIPPDSEMVIFQGILHLTPREEVRGQHMPVDSFLRSLAQDRRNNAIAVIMSGTGSDGSIGIRSVKGEGGIVFAQDETAKYNGMPKSAIDTGCVDFVLPPDKIAAELLRIRRHPYLASVRRGETVRIIPAEENDLNKVFIMLRSAKGVDFTSYKPSTIMRRVNRRMLLQKIEGIEEYVVYLKQNPSEIETLYQDILINVTSFFREPGAFDALKTTVFPHIVNKALVDYPVRIWVPACSTGEEAYSIAIALVEYMDDNKISRPVQFFATDIDDIAVEKARKGMYPENISRDVSPERLRRFFEKTGGGYVINKLVREMCIFAKQNIVKDPPFSRIDLISCRNVLIYFGPELQKKALRILFYALGPKGFLMIGPSETVGEFASLFSVVDKKNTIYAKKGEQSGPYFEAPPVEYGKEKVVGQKAKGQSTGLLDIQKEADTIVLAKYSPAGFVVNDAMKILQFRGDTGPYLRPAPGEASLNLLKMVSEDLVTELRTAIHQAKKEDIPVRKEGLRVKHNKRIKYINVEVVPFKAHASGERCFLVLLEETGKSPIVGGDLKPAPAAKGRPKDEETVLLRQELAASKAHLNTVTQEYEAANEELSALNEELQSSNEEMQSINEEMETAKEELQSTNEELTTVNDELQSRNEETTQLNNDLANVLRGVEIPIILLGNELQIKRFNDAAAKMLNLIPSDVGRPISNIRTNINIPDLDQMVLDVINSLAIKEREVQDNSDRWYSLTIRPYKTVDNRIDGVLMTIVDINDIKLSLLRIKEAYDYANDIVETVREPLLILSSGLKVITANRSFYDNFLVNPEETEGRYIHELGNGQWNIPDLKKLLQGVLPEKKSFSNFEVIHEFPNMGRKVMMLNAREIRKDVSYKIPVSPWEKEYAGMILLAIEDITERKQTEEALWKSNTFNQSIIDSSYDCIKLLDLEGRLQYMNPGGQRQLGIQDMGKYLNVPYKKFWKGSDQQAALEAIHKAQQGHPGTFQGYCPTVDGLPKWWDVAITPIIGSDGKPERLLTVSRDITERKKTEAALQESEERYRSLFENMIDGYAHCRIIFENGRPQDFIYLNVNSVFEKLTGLKNVIGKKVTEVIPGIRESHPELFEIYGRVALTGEPERFELFLEPLAAWLSISVYSTKKEYFVAVFDNITERKKAEEKIRNLNEDLQRHSHELELAYKDMEGFSYAASHDLRSPLITIEGFSNMLLEDYAEKLDDKGKDLLRRVSGNARKMKQLIEDLFAFARVSTKEIQKSEFNMEGLAQKLVDELKPTIGERNIKFDIRQVPSAYGDLSMINQALMNLLSNAIKFTKKRDTAMIEVGGYAENDENIYYVQDNGIGFDMRSSDKLFGLFQRIHTSQDLEGTGIGLVIVKRVIEKHGGRVWAEGKPDEGAKFYFTLPRTR
jgi:two-component system, chemotaxis family, CheB/CheR fusion protein